MKLQNQKLFQAVYGFSLILGFCHHLVPQIGVLHLRDIGVSESTPGPIMVNLATYVGTSQAGFIGAMIATFAVVLPSFLIMLAVTAVLPKVIKNKYVQAALRGIKPSMIGIILDKIEKSRRPVLFPGNGVRLAGAMDDFQKLV